jgi:HlyD family secretion protein
MKKALIISAVVLVLLCGAGGYYLTRMQSAMMAAMNAKVTGHTVAKGDLVVSVVDTGTIDAVNSVEVKSRVSGRLSKLLVEEGDYVQQGQIIGTIDPQETQFQVAQNQAQLSGAQSGAARTAVEIKQRRVTAQADYQQALSRLHRLEMETKAQPTLTNAAITEATSDYNRAVRDRESLVKITQPNARTRAVTTQRDAQVNYENAKREQERQSRLLGQGYVAGRDAESAALALEVARLKMEQANDELSRIDHEFSLQLSQANESVRSSEAALRRARTNSIQDNVKREEYRQAVADVSKARAALSDVEALQMSRDQSLATVSQLTSVLKDSQRQLRETQIRSPITGVVTKKMLKEGELATGLSGFSAGTPIVRIEDRTALRVLLNVNEIDVAKMAKGMKANVTVDAYPNDKFTGKVFRIAPTSVEAQPGQAASDAVVKYEVELRMDANDPRLRSGMSAKCVLDVVRKDNVIVVPRAYVGKDDKGVHYVNLAPTAKGGSPTRKDVKVGAEGGAQYEIVSGVNVGDKLVEPAFTGPARKGMMQMGPDDQ